MTQFRPFSGLVALPDFARSFMLIDQAPEEPRRLVRNDVKWDKPIVPTPQVDRQLLSEPEVQLLFAQRGVTTETAP